MMKEQHYLLEFKGGESIPYAIPSKPGNPSRKIVRGKIISVDRTDDTVVLQLHTGRKIKVYASLLPGGSWKKDPYQGKASWKHNDIALKSAMPQHASQEAGNDSYILEVDESKLVEFSFNRLLKHVQSDEGFAILSAELAQLNGKALTPQENKARTQKLKTILKRNKMQGFKQLKGQYKYDDGTVATEVSFFIPGMSFQTAKRLAKIFGQESFIWGKHNKPRGFYTDGGKVADWSTKWSKLQTFGPMDKPAAKSTVKGMKRSFAFAASQDQSVKGTAKRLVEHAKTHDLLEFKQDLMKQMIILVGAPASGKGYFVQTSFKKYAKSNTASLSKSFPRLNAKSLANEVESDNSLRRAQYQAAKEDLESLKKAESEFEFDAMLKDKRYQYTADKKTYRLADALSWEELKKRTTIGKYYGKKGDKVNKYYMSLRGRDSISGEELKTKARKMFADSTRYAIHHAGNAIIIDSAGEDINATPFEKFFEMAKKENFAVTLVQLNLPLKLSLKRNELRGKKGRKVPDSQVTSAFKSMEASVKKLRQSKNIDRFVRYDWKATGDGPFDGAYVVGVDDKTYLKKKLAAMRAAKSAGLTAANLPESLAFTSGELFKLPEAQELQVTPSLAPMHSLTQEHHKE